MAALAGFVNVSEVLRSGVYALVHRGEVVYVGKAKAMLTRVYSHRRAWGDKRQKARELPSWFPIKGIMFDEVWVQPVALADLDRVEREMIARYRPRHNILLKPKAQLPSLCIRGAQIGPIVERRV